MAVEIIRRIAGRSLASIPLALRFGATYARVSRFLATSSRWTQQQMTDFQFLSTQRILQRAAHASPWYKRRFDECGVSPEDFKAPEDIRRFPFLTKEELRDNLAALVLTDHGQKRVDYITTGGSTGLPVGFLQSRHVLNTERAFFGFQWAPYGVRSTNLSVVLRGAYVGSSAAPIRYFPHAHEWHLSVYQLTEERVPEYVDFICRVRPAFIQAYPSAIIPVARHMLEKGIDPPRDLKVIMCGSENLYPSQRRTIEDAFGVPVHTWYGQAEKVCLAVAEPRLTGLAVLPQYGLTELVGRSDQQVKNEGESGEIVATSFWNDVIPFVRYRTGDIGVLASKVDDTRYPTAWRLERIEGRLQEFLVTANERLISMTAINMHDDIFDGLRYFQFYQDRPGEVVLKVVPKGKANQVQTARIESGLKEKLGEDCTITVTCVDALDRTTSGKFRFIEQHLDIRAYQNPGSEGPCAGS